MINVQLEENGPITQMDEFELGKIEGVVDNDNEHTTWVEYWLGGRVVHRSAHVTLKQGLVADGALGAF